MTVTSSYGVEIRKMNICFRKTLEYYRGAVAWLITAYESVWEELKQIPGTKQQFNQKSKSPPSKVQSFREGTYFCQVGYWYPQDTNTPPDSLRSRQPGQPQEAKRTADKTTDKTRMRNSALTRI